MPHDRTTIAVQRYLDQLADVQGDASAEPIIRELITRSVDRLHLLCGHMLARKYPRLRRPPLNLQSEEMLSAVVDRLLRAMRQVRPTTVRQFFALANKHMRWELNDLARRLDNQTPALEVTAALAAAPDSNGSQLSQNAVRMLDAIESLPDDLREVFSLVRIQGMTHSEAAAVLGVSPKSIQRRLNRGMISLTESLADLKPAVEYGHVALPDR